MEIGDSDYVAVSRTLALTPTGEGATVATKDFPTAIILRSRTDRLRFLSAVHRDLAGTAILAVLAATLVSYGIARTVTRPLGTITATMREMAATGDLTQKNPAACAGAMGGRRRPAAGDDLQHDDRLDRAVPARGRPARAAVVARPAVDRRRARDPQPADDHQDGAARPRGGRAWPPEALRTAVADIDEEITRLNRIVSEVLDFARPIKFDLAPADLNALCDDAAKAVSVDTTLAVTRDLDAVARARSSPTPNGCGWPWSTS